MVITEWAEDDRPREKLELHGPSALSNAELLAILIGSGKKNMTAVDLMKHVMSDCAGSLNALGKKTIEELCEYPGIGKAKAITILAACELGRRRQLSAHSEERDAILSSKDIYNTMQPILRDKTVEEVWALYLNNSGSILKKSLISTVGITHAVADVRPILKQAVLTNATGIVLCHNHPSGRVRPSGADNAITKQLRGAAELLDMRLIDHVIVAENGYYSYSDDGCL